eukprot:6220264-Amphidinium_carterae.1
MTIGPGGVAPALPNRTFAEMMIDAERVMSGVSVVWLDASLYPGLTVPYEALCLVWMLAQSRCRYPPAAGFANANGIAAQIVGQIRIYIYEPTNTRPAPGAVFPAAFSDRIITAVRQWFEASYDRYDATKRALMHIAMRKFCLGPDSTLLAYPWAERATARLDNPQFGGGAGWAWQYGNKWVDG